MDAMLTVEALEEALSRPTAGVLETLQRVEGDVMVLGAGGKMGPTLVRMLRRGMDGLGQRDRRVVAVSRFSAVGEAEKLEALGVEVIRCDLLERTAVQRLPKVPNVIFMAGQKFGTSEAPERTWVMNTVVPAMVAEHLAEARWVVFSTGCVYPIVAVGGGGAKEEDELGPPGDYANSCVGRERVFGHYARVNGTQMLMYRLSYAIDLRYGVLVDVAQKVMSGEPVDLTMGYANVIWQGDANARAIQCLERVTQPPVALNVTGLEPVAIRDLAVKFGERLGKAVKLRGEEGERAWLFDASRSYDWFGPPEVSLEEMIEATARWLEVGGVTLGKPTHFEVSDGDF
jgi:nucleoside-diphosphate-sugar epimerase